MSLYDNDGYVELDFNIDHTQIIGKIYPPRGLGIAISSREIVERLRAMGVVFGIREGEIQRAVQTADDRRTIVQDAIVAQGTVPMDGADAQITWQMDEVLLCSPLPRTSFGAIDYFRIEDARKVTTGDVIAHARPATVGVLGRTVVHPVQMVHQKVGRDLRIQLGHGARLSPETHKITAEVNGFVEIRGDRLTIHPFEWLEGVAPGSQSTFAGGVAIDGDIRNCRISTNGPLALEARVLNSQLRSRGVALVNHMKNTTLVADGAIFVGGYIGNCNMTTPEKVMGSAESQIVGGVVQAKQGLEAGSAGDYQRIPTRIVIGTDHFTKLRQDEIEDEIKSTEASIQQITTGMRPLSAHTRSGGDKHKQALAEIILLQREHHEDKLNDLHIERRRLSAANKSVVEGTIQLSGRIFPCVTIALFDHEETTTSVADNLTFAVDRIHGGIHVIFNAFSVAA